MRELVFEVNEEVEGGFSAEALGEAIFTQGDTWEELRANVQDATRAHFFDTPEDAKPTAVRLLLRRVEILAIA